MTERQYKTLLDAIAVLQQLNKRLVASALAELVEAMKAEEAELNSVKAPF